MSAFGLRVVESKHVPAGKAIMLAPSTITVPEGLTLDQILDLVVIDLTQGGRLTMIDFTPPPVVV